MVKDPQQGVAQPQALIAFRFSDDLHALRELCVCVCVCVLHTHAARARAVYLVREKRAAEKSI